MSSVRFYAPQSQFPTQLCACGAVTVSKRKVVTAAHCMKEEYVVLALNFGSRNIENPYYKVNITREQITLHPKYNGTSKKNDIAVIDLPEDIVFSERVGEIEMADKNDHLLKVGAKVIILGYTKCDGIDMEIRQSDLRYIESTIADFDTCAEAFWKRSSIRLNRETYFCVDMCNGVHCINKGDSGGKFVNFTPHLLTMISISYNLIIRTSLFERRKEINWRRFNGLQWATRCL